jgi:DDE superfamily endonuclease
MMMLSKSHLQEVLLISTKVPRKQGSFQVHVRGSSQRRSYTRYGGAVAVKEAWERFDVAGLLAEAGIHYGQSEDRAEAMSLALTLGPLVQATSVRQVAQRFGGEASPAALEADALLCHLLSHSCDQRALARFMGHPRHDWEALQQRRVGRLLQIEEFAGHADSVIILDDLPLPKPYAKEMAYLSPIWDNNLKHTVPGYAVVHLYYYQPRHQSYSLCVAPWLKTSATGEAKKKTARRAARPGEEESKLDIGLHLLDTTLACHQLPFAALLFDSWYTCRWFGHELTQRGIPWIGEASARQKFEVADDYLSVSQLHERYHDQLRKLKRFKQDVRAVAFEALIRPDQYTKVTQPVRLVLVEGLHKPRDNDKGYKLLVCNRPAWSLRRIVRLFSWRPRIEPIHRQGKQFEGWNLFHTRSLAALLCHLSLSLLRSTLLSLMRLWQPRLAQFSLAQMISYWIQCVAQLIVDATRRLVIVQIDTAHAAWEFL